MRYKILNTALSIALISLQIEPIVTFGMMGSDNLDAKLKEEKSVNKLENDIVESNILKQSNLSLEATTNEVLENRLTATILETGVHFRGKDESPVYDSWGNYNDIKTLRIEADFTGYTSEKTIKIQLAKGMMLRTEPSKLVDNKQIVGVDVSDYKKEEISTSNAGNLSSEHGTIVLNVSDDKDYVILDILVSIDERFYNFIENQKMTEGDAIKIIANTENKNLTQKTLDNVFATGELNTGSLWVSGESSLVTDSQIHRGFQVGINGFNTNFAEKKRFYKEIELRVTIPYTKKIVDGVEKRKYAEVLKMDSIGESSISGNEMVIRYKNVYIDRVPFNYYYYFDDSEISDGDTVYYEEGEIRVLGMNDVDYVYKRGKDKASKTIYSLYSEKLTLGGAGLSIFNDDNDFYHLAGSFSLSNKAGKTKAKNLKFEFPYGDNALVGAGTMRIIVPTEPIKNFKIKIELWEKETNNIYEKEILVDKGETKASTGYNLSLNDIKKEMGYQDKELYFKSIEYDVPYFSSDFSAGGGRTPGQVGIYMVKVFNERKGSATNSTAKMTLSDIDGETLQKTVIGTKSATPVFADTGVTTAGLHSSTEFRNLNGNSLHQKSIVAGEEFYLYGRTVLSDYLYNNANFLKNPLIKVRIPEGVEIDFDRTVFSFDSNFSKELDFICLNQNNPIILNDGSRLYNFVFSDKNIVLGGVDSNGKMNGNAIFWKVYMKTRKNTKAISLDVRETIFLDSETMSIKNGGSWNQWTTNDKYDVNQNGNTGEAVITSNTSRTVSIVPQIWVDSELKLTLNNDDLSTSNVTLTRPKQTLTLKISLANDTDWIVNKDTFKYYFPVPKKGVKMSSYFNQGEQQLNLSYVDSFVSEGLKLMYSTDEEAYMSPDSAVYHEELPSDLNEVRMIKIITEEDLGKNTDKEISVTYRYEGSEEEFDQAINQKSLFSPYGWINMTLNGATMAGYDTFPQVRITTVPLLLKQPENMTVNIGEIARTSIQTEEKDAKIQWQSFDTTSSRWVDLNGQTKEELVLSNTQLSEHGKLYRAVITGSDGVRKESDSVRLTVLGHSVIIPKQITLDETTELGEYRVLVKGNIGNSTLSVTPDTTLTMEDEKGKAPVKGLISQQQTTWHGADLSPFEAEEVAGQVEVLGLTAGSWRGQFNFKISVK